MPSHNPTTLNYIFIKQKITITNGDYLFSIYEHITCIKIAISYRKSIRQNKKVVWKHATKILHSLLDEAVLFLKSINYSLVT